MYEEKIIPPKKAMPQAQDGTLRKFALRVPEVIYQCSGIMVFGKRIKSLVFSTDLSIIKNVNADAIIAVYPFTPQPIITQALLLAADIPVFAGVGGGLTQGQRVVNLAMFAEMQGATGVVVNAPTPGRILNRIRSSVDVPVVVTVANSDTNYRHRIEDGAAILNVAAGAQTPEIVAEMAKLLIEDKTDLKAHVARGLLAAVNVLPVEKHGAGCRREQPVEVLDERAFAGARVADDAHELSGGNVKINIVDGDFFKRCPGTVDVPKVIHPDDWRHNFVSFIGEDR